jgi:hypothetical protein
MLHVFVRLPSALPERVPFPFHQVICRVFFGEIHARVDKVHEENPFGIQLPFVCGPRFAFVDLVFVFDSIMFGTPSHPGHQVLGFASWFGSEGLYLRHGVFPA